MDIFDVNEDQSFIDISLKFKLQWYDKGLTFKFLKVSDNENTLDDDSVEKIWKPDVIMEVIKKETTRKKRRNIHF